VVGGFITSDISMKTYLNGKALQDLGYSINDLIDIKLNEDGSFALK
jgi:hypothetical protein